MREQQVLHDEFDVDEPARVLFEVEVACGRRGLVGVHFLSHGEDVVAQVRLRRAGEDFLAQGGVARGEFRAAGDGAAARQRLVFPGPGVFALVAGKALDAADRQATRAAGAQAGVDVVDDAVAARGA